jgi:cytochrome c-type biogenesis protein CcmF
MPVAWGLILLMGIGPYIPWRKASILTLKEILTIPFFVGFCSLPFFYLTGIQDYYALAALSVTLFTLTAIARDFSALAKMWAKHDGISLLRGLIKAFRQNPRKSAGILTHLGVLVMTIGIVCSTLFQTEKMQIIKPNETLALNNYKIKLTALYPVTGVNWSGHEGLLRCMIKRII